MKTSIYNWYVRRYLLLFGGIADWAITKYQNAPAYRED